MNVQIAKAKPFEGKPTLLIPTVLGVSIGKPFIYRIPAIGERPLYFSVDNLPEGVKLDGRVLTGCIEESGEWNITIKVRNAQGDAEKNVLLTCAQDNALRTPLMGFTSWSAFCYNVTQQDIQRTAQQLVDQGIADYGYGYVNLDSGWQLEYGGEFDAIQPNWKFPDMKEMYDYIHSLGLRGGIYSTPMLTAWGCPPELESIPGCTRGEVDLLRTNVNGGVGLEHMEENNVRQWEQWGVDYLKYDWAPTDPFTCDPMKQALLKSVRDIPLCTSVRSGKEYAPYWSRNCSSWRDNPDSRDNWERLLEIMATTDGWKPYVRPGHFFDLDMLEIGDMYWNKGKCGLTDAEELFCYSLRAFFASPLQLSCRLENLTAFEFDMICNEEAISINQDALADYPESIDVEGSVRVYRRKLENGDEAYALFNMENQASVYEIDLPANVVVRDVWMKETLPAADKLRCELPPHGARIFRLSAAKNNR